MDVRLPKFRGSGPLAEGIMGRPWIIPPIAILIASALSVTLMPVPRVTAETASRAQLERQHADLSRTNEALDKESEQAVEQILKGVQADMEARRRALEAEVKIWREDAAEGGGSERFPADYRREREEWQRGIREGQEVARARGLDVELLTRIYDAMKKVIRNADFSIPVLARTRADDPTLEGRVSQTFLGAEEDERTIAEARLRHRDYRWGLYRNATQAYVRALLASKTPPPECRAGVSGTARVKGKDVPLLNCPDPVVKELRNYLAALRKIQSADVESLASDLETLIAEQQFTVDLLAMVPFVGDAMDGYLAWYGEDLFGNPAGRLERGFTWAMLLIPNVGPQALEYAAKRSPRVKEALETISLYISALSEFTEWYMRELKAAHIEIGYDLMERAARNWGGTVPQLKEVAEYLKKFLPDANARFVSDALRDAAFGRISILSLPAAERRRVMEAATKSLVENLGVLQPASRADRIRMGGMVDTHAEAFLSVAQRRREIFIARPVNPDAAKLIRDLGAPTKPMHIKAKSATLKPIAAMLPVEQSLNKYGADLIDARRRLEAAKNAGQNIDVLTIADEIKDLEKKIEKGKIDIDKCFAPGKPPCALKVPVPVEVGGQQRTLHHATHGDGEAIFVVEDGRGGWMDPDTGTAVATRETPREVLVLGDPRTGRPYVADYDLLNFGEQGARTGPGFSGERGFTTPNQREAIQELNDEVRRQSGFDGGDVVHHGAEQHNPSTPGVDYPLTAFEPNGNIVHIPECDLACMKRWCETTTRCRPDQVGREILVDKDRLLKDYFHQKRLPPESFNLDPNPRWRWGPYDGLSGWLPVPVSATP
jgi:hypothetical protein